MVACFVVAPDQEGALAGELDATTTELVRKVGAMPRYMGLGIQVLTVVFECWGLLTGGRRFSRLARPKRERQIQTWQGSPIGLMRDTVEFYEKMGTFVFWSGREEPH